jgi:hypothetical protein
MGSFILGPAVATVGGQVLRSNAVAVRVVARREPETFDPQMFLQAVADKTEVHLGEQVTVSYYLYARVSYLGLELRREPTTVGFWVEEAEVPRGFQAYSQTVVRGMEYRVQLLKRQALFPLRAGKLTIGPMALDAQVGFGFFSTGRKLSRSSRPLEINVLPLPAQGRPPGFHQANVGQFTLSGGVDRQSIAMGEAVKYRVQLEGHGNIKNVKIPEVPDGLGYRRFDPEPKISVRIENNRVGGTRVLEYLLSPTRPGRFVVPALAFHYFDPDLKVYRSATIPEQPVTVSGGPGAAVAAAAAAPPPGLDPDLHGIRESVDLGEGGTPLYRAALFWALVLSPPLLYLLLFLGGRLAAIRAHLRLRGEPRRRAAQAWKRLREAERLLDAENADAFYAEIARVLGTFLEVKLGQPVRGLTLPELRATLAARAFPEGVVEAVLEEMENCDFGRFAPREGRREEMKNALARTRGLLDDLDRVRPAPLETEGAAEVAR